MDTVLALTRNPLKDKLARGELVTSMIVRMARGPEIGGIAAAAGMDALYVDLEHSPLSLETTAVVCSSARAAGVVPLVRVPALDPSLICRILDAGAMGIVVPHVTSATDAQRAMSAALYPPQGERSVSSGQALLQHRNVPQAQANAALNASTFVALMIESREAIERIDDIAAVAGVDMLLIGAGDLATSLGHAGQLGHDDVSAALASVLAAGRRHGRTIGLGGLAGEPALLQRWVDAGATFVSTGTDVAFLCRAASQAVQLVREIDRRRPSP